MSAKEQIGRLQGLLERVQMRANDPRSPRTPGTNGTHAYAAAATSTVAGAEVEQPRQAQSGETAPPPTPMYADQQVDQVEQPTFPTSPPPDTSPPPPTTSESHSFDMESDGDVEVSSEVVEVDIDVDEPMPMESGAQPVAHQTMPPEDLEEAVDEAPSQELQPAQDSDEVTLTATAANEIEEPTPSSSRRPIASEEPQPETYEEESAPRHTPPPESGKQVAAPSVHPPSWKPSAPPPSLEGHTLIGGWREPGLGPQASPVAGGAAVRVPGPPPPRGGDAAAFAAAAPQASGTRLSPDVTKPDLGSAGAGAVASFQGFAAIPKPTTLGDLLDLTLGL